MSFLRRHERRGHRGGAQGIGAQRKAGLELRPRMAASRNAAQTRGILTGGRRALDEPSVARLTALFDRALSVPRARRAAFLTEVCAGDIALRTELDSLL